ncbi:MAG: hypothetical protein HYV27_00465 [Candidatus Hydrogenedentes bacterium]|nr:hypothetical protein [Candidatus Hydrogenedentota bacterium]
MVAHKCGGERGWTAHIMSTRGNAWIYGCGIGCAVMLLIAVAVSVAGYFFVSKAAKEGQSALREEITGRYASLKETGKVPAEHVVMYDRFVELMNRETTGLTVGSTAMMALDVTLQDGAVSETEVKFILDFIAFMETSPDAGPIKLGEFLAAHPEFNQVMEDASRAPGSYSPQFPVEDLPGDTPVVGDAPVASDVPEEAPVAPEVTEAPASPGA